MIFIILLNYTVIMLPIIHANNTTSGMYYNLSQVGDKEITTQNDFIHQPQYNYYNPTNLIQNGYFNNTQLFTNHYYPYYISPNYISDNSNCHREFNQQHCLSIQNLNNPSNILPNYNCPNNLFSTTQIESHVEKTVNTSNVQFTKTKMPIIINTLQHRKDCKVITRKDQHEIETEKNIIYDQVFTNITQIKSRKISKN
ncbi:Hypothetical protein EIN_017940, partial [Entamoeba invadens IP1]|uniref:Hypothetical protein n=1 Tax=Entamoeba invadens IP1 TaxID=370355 RepID=UPI0002C3E3A8